MKLRPQAIDCPNCGASLDIRNARKAKTTVCGTCGSQLDLTKPDFAILGTLKPSAEPPVGPIRLGMHGEIDGHTHEVIGRLRYRDEDSYWDEWLLVNEDTGRYIWLSEESGSYTLQKPFDPEEPVETSKLYEGSHFSIDGDHYRVTEADQARVAHVEGELTWRATVGDSVNYADAIRGIKHVGFEWTDDEYEVFESRKVSRSELWRIFDLASHAPDVTAELERAAKMRGTAMFLGIAAVLAMVMYFVAPQFKSIIARSDGSVKLQASDVRHGIKLGSVHLGGGLGHYMLEGIATMPGGMDQYQFRMMRTDTPVLGKTAVILQIDQDGRRGVETVQRVPFKVPEAGDYDLVLKGKESKPSKNGDVSWSIYKRILDADYFFWGMLLLGILAFVALWQSAAVQNAANATMYGELYDED